ncbi:J domain-containing protein, partial [Enterococcus faecium]
MSHASTGFVNWYDILGVARDATPEEIKRAWRDMAKRYHPDGNQD